MTIQHATLDLVGHITDGPHAGTGGRKWAWVVVATPTNSPGFRVVAPTAAWAGISPGNYVHAAGALRLQVTATSYYMVVEARTLGKVEG